MKANVILMKCPKAKRTYGVRIEESCGDWFRTWAFPMDEGRASHEGYDKTKITGNLAPYSEFNGCPYCGSHSCPSFYGVDQWGNGGFFPELCPQYKAANDAATRSIRSSSSP